MDSSSVLNLYLFTEKVFKGFVQNTKISIFMILEIFFALKGVEGEISVRPESTEKCWPSFFKVLHTGKKN